MCEIAHIQLSYSLDQVPIFISQLNKATNVISYFQSAEKGDNHSLSLCLPPVTTKYPNTWSLIINDDEGEKLIIRTKTLNALITSRLRMDSIHEAIVGGIITTFELDQSTAATTGIFFGH